MAKVQSIKEAKGYLNIVVDETNFKEYNKSLDETIFYDNYAKIRLSQIKQRPDTYHKRLNESDTHSFFL